MSKYIIIKYLYIEVGIAINYTIHWGLWHALFIKQVKLRLFSKILLVKKANLQADKKALKPNKRPTFMYN